MLSSVYVDFQPSGALPAPGYLSDTGAAFGDRGGGLHYGWNVDHSAHAVERMLRGDARLDTFIAFESGGVWEIELPNGTYDVRLTVGDAGQASTHSIVIEGATYLDAQPAAANEFLQVSAEIVVADGRLTIDQALLPTGSTRIDYVEIVPDATPGNASPLAPTISEPALDGKVVNSADVHLEIVDYIDPDDDSHLNTDWEIWTAGQGELAWQTAAISGVEKVHTHLGDGVFLGAHAGRSELFPDTDYVIRVRVRDARSAVSSYAIKTVRTGSPTAVFGLSVEDVLDNPPPAWTNELSAGSVVLPAAASSARLRLESPLGESLLEYRGLDGLVNEVINPASLGYHAAVRLVAEGGDSGLALPQSRLTFNDSGGASHEVYLPSLALGAHETAVFWVSASGATYVGDLGQTAPDFSTVARGAPVPWLVRQPGYVVEVVATGFQLPVNIAFVPSPGPNPGDPLYYVTELYGAIKVVTNDGTVSDYATNLLNFNPTGNFPGSGEQGLTGIVVDPTNGDVYAGMVYSSNPNNDLAPHYPKVVRFTSSDGGLTAATQTTILDMVGETQGQSHQISNFTFGPDGMLYVHNGDGFLGSTSQNLNFFRGKVLRMTRDGAPLADNPFYDGAPFTARDYVFARGLRNPFGGAWRVSDGVHYEVENGPSVDRLAQVVAGRNFGYTSGNDASMANFATYNWFPAVAPVNITFVEPAVFGGSGFPETKFGHAYVAESGSTYATGPQANGKKITEFQVGSNGEHIAGPTTLIEYNGSGKATAVALASGPDGLYFSDFYKDQDYDTPIDRGSNILRIRFEGYAAIGSDVTVAEPGQGVQFLDASVVPNAVAWSWDFGDGQTSSDQNPVHAYAATGVYDVRLIVTTSTGRLLTTVRHAYVTIDVAPRIVALEVGNGAAWYAPPVGSGEQLRTVPLGGSVDRVRITFDRAVSPSIDDLSVIGQRWGAYPVLSVSYQPATQTATWVFATPDVPLGDRLEVSLATSLASTIGLPLDGEWSNPTSLEGLSGSVFPSGDGYGGGALQFRVTILPGDANRDNIVTGADYTIWADHYDDGQGPGGQTFEHGDFTGDGYVTGADYTLWGDNYEVDFSGPLEGSLPVVRRTPFERKTSVDLAPLREIQLPRRESTSGASFARSERLESAPRPKTALRPRAVDAALVRLTDDWR